MMWEFERIRKYAVDAINKHQREINPATLVRLGLTYDFKYWVLPAYGQLIMREESISEEEAEELGLCATMTLLRLRDGIWMSEMPRRDFDEQFQAFGDSVEADIRSSGL